MPKPTFFNLPDAKRQRIIDAAIVEFCSRPYAKATLDRIVADAGVSKGSMYQYFSGKADLYGWLLTEHMGAAKLAAIAHGSPDESAGVWASLESAFLAGVRFATAQPKLALLGSRFLRDRDLEPELAAIAKANDAAARAWLRTLLHKGQSQGEIRPDLDLDVAVDLLQHVMGDGMLQYLARQVDLPLHTLLEQPEALSSLSDRDLTALVRRVTGVLRHGTATR